MGLFGISGGTLQDTIQLLKNTFTVIARNPAIFKPTVTQIVVGIVLWVLLIGSFVSFYFVTGAVVIIAVIILIFSVLMLILFPFIKTYYRAAQCWIVYQTFTGNKISYKKGLARARQNKKDIFILGLLDILLTALSGKLKEGTGRGGLWAILNILMRMAGAAVEEGWDLVGHFLLPGSIIPEKTVGEAISDIKDIRNNVPGALVGVFGIDFVGDLVRGYIIGIAMLLIVGVGGGLYLATHSLVAIGIGVILALILHFVAGIFIDMVKTVYFTIFYTAVTMPEEIPEEDREEVTHYLTSVSGEGIGTPKSEQQFIDPKARQLIPVVQQYKSQGYTDDKISSLLMEKGWSEEIVRKAIDMAV
uniref:Uncharacterized protein n=1 Tax=Candidatus Methanogaster sp. ANME-2c ERB4 TaxID=2759911 RepID=A0A7G9XZK7_9EURY|nr:hypothetical protein JNOLDJLP_00015 [Methanosarcinales archaeon ANME-2c ERB4]QNO41595.1 hypothetical protein OAEIHDOC_00015 [Methanosarcinales archaeon ANME-2c ERB4]